MRYVGSWPLGMQALARRCDKPGVAKKKLRFSDLKKAFAAVNDEIQTVLEEAAETRGATEVRLLSTAAGICVDRWSELDEIPDDLRDESDGGLTCSHCIPESEIQDTERLFNEWLPKAYKAIQRARGGLKETGKGKSKPGDLVAWMTAAGIGAQKVIRYHLRLSNNDRATRIMAAHRHEMGSLMEKLNVARLAIACMNPTALKNSAT
jgi:hypothetical protein